MSLHVFSAEMRKMLKTSMERTYAETAWKSLKNYRLTEA